VLHKNYGFYTGSADHVPKENVNTLALPGYINVSTHFSDQS